MDKKYNDLVQVVKGTDKRDNSLFTKGRSLNYDLLKYLKPETVKRIFNQKAFTVNLHSMDLKNQIKDFEEIDNVDEFLLALDKININISLDDRAALEKDFDKEKKRVLKTFSNTTKGGSFRWMRFRDNYLQVQEKENSWPLYVGTGFVSYKKNDISIYGPLFLKKAEIEIDEENETVSLKSIDDSVELNEKIVFILERELGIKFPIIKADSGFSFEALIKIFLEKVKILKPLASFVKEFDSEYDDNASKDKVEMHPGVVLSVMTPTGGQLKKRLLNILEKKKDNQEFISFKHSLDITQAIENNIKSKVGLYRITPTDLSQEIAVIGSLKDSAVIWGPPGTGKSQTICNIIANILHDDKLSIVTSEKKAALDVIKERMGKLSKYAFFGLVDKHMDKQNKAEFYRSFQELVALLEKDPQKEKRDPYSYVKDSQIIFDKQRHLLADDNVEDVVNVYIFLQKNPKLGEQIRLLHQILSKNGDLVKEIRTRYENIDLILEEKFGVKPNNKKLVKSKQLKEVNALKYAINMTKNDEGAMLGLINIKNIENVFNVEAFLHNEHLFVTADNEFRDDTDYIEKVLADRFRKRMNALQKKEEWQERIDIFLKQTKAGFRVPYKFININQDIIEQIYTTFISTPQTLSAFTEKLESVDYAIFDEASQMHVEKAIPFLVQAKINIVVGDNQQMRPSSFFSAKGEEVSSESLLDYAYNIGLKEASREYMLNKNYRSSVGELMLFSSKEFYESNLDVIDNRDKIGTKAIEVFNVDGKWEGRINEKEAIASLNWILKNYKEYKSIILLTLNMNQLEYLNKLLYVPKYRPILGLIQTDKLKLRNLENIQGDEAELVVISLAYDRNARLSATYVARAEGRNALNVAISRAQDKVIIFKSISSKEIKLNKNNPSMKTFKLWLEYLELSPTERRQYLDEPEEAELSEEDNERDLKIIEKFEIIRKGFDLDDRFMMAPRVSLGSYTVDFAIIDKETKDVNLIVEFITYTDYEGFRSTTKTIERKKFLQAKGYPTILMSELDWKLNQRECVAKIKLISDRIGMAKDRIEVMLKR